MLVANLDFDIDMPESCYDCLYCNADGKDEFCQLLFCSDREYSYADIKPYGDKGRNPNCPLKEVAHARKTNPKEPFWIDADKVKPEPDVSVLVLTEDRAGIGLYDSVTEKWFMWILKDGEYELARDVDVCYWFPIPYIPGTPNFPPRPVWLRTGKEIPDMHMRLPNREGWTKSWLSEG